MAFTAGSLSQVAVTSVTSSLLSTAASSGTTPYAYQWYRAVTSGFTPVASYAVSGATGLTLIDTNLTPSTIYYYKVVSIDSNATPATVSTAQLASTTLADHQNLSIANVINISVATPQTGLGNYNTANVALFTREATGSGFGSLGYKIYLSPVEVADDFGTSSACYAMANALFSQQPNILLNGGYLVIIPFLSSETLTAALVRTAGLVQYFGIIQSEISSQVDMLAAAAAVQALNKLVYFVSNASASVAAGGLLDLLQSGGFTHSRGLYYGDDVSSALAFMAAYVGLGQSTVFSGSNTTQTMHLKSLSGIQPDPSMSQTLLALCQDAGADVYVSLQGVAKVFCSGENDFFDNVFNTAWFVGALEVAGFNYLAQTNTKIPQTEVGMDGLKGAYRKVCEQGGVNQFLAPGSWTSPTTFGNQADLYLNVSQRGYYIYSQPVSQQSPTDRADREAPLVQIAIKFAGAIHSSSVIVFVNS